MQNLYRGEYKQQQQQNNNYVTFIAAKFDYIFIEKYTVFEFPRKALFNILYTI